MKKPYPCFDKVDTKPTNNDKSYITQSKAETKQVCEHKNLSEAIADYNLGVSTTRVQKELWTLWKFNHVVYVPTYQNYSKPYDLAIVPISAGQAYVFFTEQKFISTENNGQGIQQMPFKELLDRVYNSNGVVNGLFINPCFDRINSEYSMGLTTDLLKKICRGDILIS